MDSKSQMLEIVNEESKLELIVKALFDEHDKEHRSHLDINEFHSILKCMYKDTSFRPPRLGEIKEIFKEIDENEDGLISFDEFKELVKKILMCALDI